MQAGRSSLQPKPSTSPSTPQELLTVFHDARKVRQHPSSKTDSSGAGPGLWRSCILGAESLSVKVLTLLGRSDHGARHSIHNSDTFHLTRQRTDNLAEALLRFDISQRPKLPGLIGEPPNKPRSCKHFDLIRPPRLTKMRLSAARPTSGSVV